MSKFKVGDRVRRCSSGGGYFPVGFETTVDELITSAGWFYCINAYGAIDSTHADNWELVHSYSGPVRTKTVKEIVPGKYGVVEVRTSAPDIHIPDNRLWTPATLREAARIFNELADALEA